MADVAVESAPGPILSRKPTIASIPTIDSLDGISGEAAADEYSEMKKLERHLE